MCLFAFNTNYLFAGRALCYVYGSLHFITFDLLVFAFQGECQYTLAKTCRDDVEPAFEVIQENVRFTEKSSVIKAIHVHIGDKVLVTGPFHMLWLGL